MYIYSENRWTDRQMDEQIDRLDIDIQKQIHRYTDK